jgi:hypothetical protein
MFFATIKKLLRMLTEDDCDGIKPLFLRPVFHIGSDYIRE